MKKIAGGIIAGSAGLVLLLAAGGTLALWNDAETVTADDVASGELDLTATGGTWTTAAPTYWVPGDEAVYSVPITIDILGDNLESALSIAENAITAATTGDATANQALADALVVTFATSNVVGPGTIAATQDADGHYPVTANDPAVPTQLTADLTVTISLPDSVPDQVAQNGAVNMENFAIALLQKP